MTEVRRRRSNENGDIQVDETVAQTAQVATQGVETLFNLGAVGVVAALALLALWKIISTLGTRALEFFDKSFTKQAEEQRALRDEVHQVVAATKHAGETNAAALANIRETLDRHVTTTTASFGQQDQRFADHDRRITRLELTASASGSRPRVVAVE